MKFKSKLPKEIRDSLAKQMKILFTGKIETLKVNINLTVPIKVGYGWGESATAQYNVQPGNKHFNNFNALLEKKIEETMKPKVDKVSDKINKFYNRLEKICKKYDSIPDDEFHIIYDEYKLSNCTDNWY
jgi:hypothetical protein